MERVDSGSEEEGAEYDRDEAKATAVEALGSARTQVDGRRLAAVRALRAATPAVDRRASIFGSGERGYILPETRPSPAQLTEQ